MNFGPRGAWSMHSICRVIVLDCLLLFSVSHEAFARMENYGFLTNFSAAPENEIRQRIRTMVEDYNIKEFQFYDWFVDYSTPLEGVQWKDPYFRCRDILLSTIKIYIEEIHRRGGRAWAYVQAAGSENPNLSDRRRNIRRVLTADGKEYSHADRFPVYLLSKELAHYQIEVWADAVASLGFDGIHWDTLGTLIADKEFEKQGVQAFIKASSELLERKGLKQTLNFIDLNWWDQSIAHYVSFPYAEIWTKTLEEFFTEMNKSDSLGVMVSYPHYFRQPPDNGFGEILKRAAQIKAHGHTFLIIGDGNFKLETEFFPARRPMSSSEMKSVSELYSDQPIAAQGSNIFKKLLDILFKSKDKWWYTQSRGVINEKEKNNI